MIEISSQRLVFKTLAIDDVSQYYVDWLNDSAVNQFLESRYTLQTIDSCRSYVADMNASGTHYLLGIYLRDSGKHIGNTKLGFINPHHQRAQLSLFIGEQECWGKGYATETIKAITAWGFNHLVLEKIDAGCSEENLGSLRAFLKSGYQVEGFFRKAAVFDGRRVGSFWMSVLKEEFTV